ncbi:helix-turn-helix transcriptional regulator [Erysipelotrichaceae bacterium RD49]|nr:helix-turn-helix transcriptional regulator [Erysipelotrichaceae bacterium RD49]
MTTGQRLRDTRLKREKTLDEVAHAIGVTATSISKYESDRIKNIPQDKLQAISEFLDVSVSYLLGLDDPINASPIVLSIDEQLLIEEYRKLSELNKETIKILCERLVEVESVKDKIVQLHL